MIDDSDPADPLAAAFIIAVSGAGNVPSVVQVGLGWFSVYEVSLSLVGSKVELPDDVRVKWSLPVGATLGDLANLIIERDPR